MIVTSLQRIANDSVDDPRLGPPIPPERMPTNCHAITLLRPQIVARGRWKALPGFNAILKVPLSGELWAATVVQE